MKPIKLKIRGLNSFIDEQIIDFEKLTAAGFFGIFGPTGSGKSTVLDGITLSLYGDVARKSSNYINTNCDSASVSFEFEISGAVPKRYIVEREFKSDKKTGNPRSGKCKVVDISNGEPMILADSVGGVTSTCKDIIGLNLDDFTRTVVLPQGKFSEFLKLEGKNRRDMLERLFNLQQYGDDLARKLTREISKEKTENSVLLGELKGYEDVNEESAKAKEYEVLESESKEKHSLEVLGRLKKVFAEGEEIYNLQKELKSYVDKFNIINSKEDEMIQKKNSVALAEGAEKVMPYITAYEKTEGQLKKIEENLAELNSKIGILKNEKEKTILLFEKAKSDKEEKLPALKLKEERIKDALAEKEVLDKVITEIDVTVKLIADLEKQQSILNTEIEELKTIDSDILNKINESELKQETLKVDSTLKENVQKGVLVQNKVSDYKNNQKQLINKIQKLTADISDCKEEEKKINNNLEVKNNELSIKEIELKTLLNNCPGETSDLLKLQDEVSKTKDSWNKYNTFINDIETSNKEIENLNSDIDTNKNLSIEIELCITDLNNKIKAYETEIIAHKLREDLKNGDVCPVCGSTHHEKNNIKHIDNGDAENLKAQLKDKELEGKKLTQKLAENKARVTVLERKVEELNENIKLLGEEFKNTTTEEIEERFNKLQKSIKEYSDKKELLEKEVAAIKESITALDQSKTKITTIITQSENQLEVLNTENISNNEILDKAISDLNGLVNETKVNDFESKSKEIIAIEKEHEELIVKIKEFRRDHQIIVDKRESLAAQFNKDKELLVSNKTRLSEREKNRDEKMQSIKTKVSNINNISGELTEVINSIKTINENFLNCEEAKNAAESEYKVCSDKLIQVTSTLTQLRSQLSFDSEKLNVALEAENYKSVEDVKEKRLSKDTISKIKVEIDNHYEEKSKTIGAMDNIKLKLNDRAITEEAFESMKNETQASEQEYEALKKETIMLEEQLKLIKTKLLELGDLLKKKEKIDHKLGLLADLEKLFKGKKFVEFVAATRLKYVSIEASKRLKEITNGSYGLEVDEDGKFIIRDYKNGGAERDASTLSGGETFLASLALALALSSEIQLKGTAPLELFFLDEGFGTLDDDLLEVVMSSLERIHNEKLKIGLISHVESIKNRVPIKLLLTPAVSGMGGSKVKIEKS